MNSETKAVIGITACVILVVWGLLSHAKYRSNPENVKLRTACVNGVTYYYSNRRLAPAYHPNGTLITCKVIQQ